MKGIDASTQRGDDSRASDHNTFGGSHETGIAWIEPHMAITGYNFSEKPPSTTIVCPRIR
jgi:hypothetical protein